MYDNAIGIAYLCFCTICCTCFSIMLMLIYKYMNLSAIRIAVMRFLKYLNIDKPPPDNVQVLILDFHDHTDVSGPQT